MKNVRKPAATETLPEDLHDAAATPDRRMAERLLEAFEHLSESIVLTDPEDRFLLANRAFRELNRNVSHAIRPGARFEDYLRAGVAAGNYPDAVGREQEWLAARLAERRNPGLPVERQRRDGRWFQINDRRLPDGCTIRFGTEITERKRAEMALDERNRELQLVVDSVPVMIARLDLDERFLFVNRAYSRLMGMPVEEIVGRRVEELISTEAYARAKDALRRARSGDPVAVERHQFRADGESFDIEGRYIPDVDVTGRVIGIFAVHRDVTAERQARRSLAAGEARFRQTFELAGSGIAHVDVQGRFTRVNRSLCRILGYSAAELVGTRAKDFSHPEDHGVTDTGRRRMFDGEVESAHFEKRYLRKDGSTVWVDLTLALVRDAEGGPEYEIAIFDDITERRLAESELTQRNRELRLVMDSVPVMISRADRDQRYVFVNRAYESLMERPATELLGRRISDVVAPEVYELVRPDIERVLAGESVRFERTQLRSDGETRELDVLYVPDLDRDGRSAGWFALHWDVTERKRAEQALAATEARFRAIFERSSAGMAITDESGTYLSVNAAFARFFGYTVEEIVGKLKVSDLRAPDDTEGPVLYRRLLAGEIGVYERDNTYRRRDGAQIWGRATVTAVRAPGGGTSYVVAVFSDITEEVLARSRTERMNAELEERVEKRTAELRAAMKELDAFTYSVSHDLRAPIGAISGFAHLLRHAESASLSEDGGRLLGFIESNAERMTRLIEGLLRFSRLGRSDLRRSRVSMNGLAAESLLDFVDDAARASIHAGAMPDCSGDPALLGQVWANLTGNALKYSRGAAAPRVDIGWDAGRSAYFVKDNGVGFDMAYADKLFGVFERLHAETEFEGSGIGLAIAERIVRLHGGSIWADAAPGQGATFWFTVPPAASAAGDLRSSPEARR